MEDTAELTEITMQALSQCDLAILVFDANKFGSWYEKTTLETRRLAAAGLSIRPLRLGNRIIEELHKRHMGKDSKKLPELKAILKQLENSYLLYAELLLTKI